MALLPTSDPNRRTLERIIESQGREISALWRKLGDVEKDRFATAHVGPTPPPNAEIGTLWYDTSEAGATGDSSGLIAPGGAGSPDPAIIPGMSFPATGSTYESGLTSTTLRGMRAIKWKFPSMVATSGQRAGASYSDHTAGRAIDYAPPNWSTPTGNALGWKVALWVRDNAQELKVKYVIFDERRWPSYDGRDAWVAYTHPSGNTTDPSLTHKDHVHTSFLA